MEWLLGAIFLIGLYFGNITPLMTNEDIIHNLEGATSNCRLYCQNNGGFFEFRPAGCHCSSAFDNHGIRARSISNVIDFEDRIIKRDTIQDIIKKNKKSKKISPKSFPLRTPTKSRNSMFTKKLPSNSKMKAKVDVRAHKQPAVIKELQDRFKELKTRMSAKPQLRARGNFVGDETPNLIEQFKSRQEEFKEKIMKAKLNPSTGGSFIKPKADGDGATRLQSINKIKQNVASSTTETSKPSHIPVIVLMSSTTTGTPEVLKSINDIDIESKKSTSTIERLKEKQKEAVMKIKDKISVTKIKPKEQQEAMDNETKS